MAGVGGEIAKAWVSIVPTAKGMGKGIESELGGIGETGGKKAGKSFVGSFAAIATAAAGAIAAGAFLKGSIAAAGDLEQSMGAIDAVFKGSSNEMHKWSKQAFNSVGLTQNEFNELGTLIGSQLKNGGTAMDQLAPKTNQLIGLGADLSSMFGGTSREAVEALSSALKGERDPIEKYGVSLNQAKIDAEAAALGFKKVGGSLSDEANQAATLSLIMKQTNDAHGNFAKESTTYQGQLQRLTAAWGDVSAKVGTAFLPVLTSLLTFVNTNIMPMITAFADSLGNGGLAGAFGGLAFVQPILKEISGGFTAMFAAFRDGGDDITSSGFAGFLEGLGLKARFVSDEVIGGFTAMFAAFQDGEDDITSSGIAGFLEGIGVAARNAADVFAAGWETLGPSIMALVPQIFELVSSFSPLSLILQMLVPFLPQIAEMLMGIMSAAAMLLGALIPLAQSILSQLMPVFMQLVSAIIPPVIAIIGSLVGILGPLIEILGPILTGVINALMPIVMTVFGLISTIITTVVQHVQHMIAAFMAMLTGDWGTFWTEIGNVFQNLLGGIGDFASQFFGELPGRILGALGDLGGLLLGAGGQILEGFLKGLTAGFENVKDFVGGIGSWIADNKGPKAYDLALLVPAGGWIMDGLGTGIEDSMPGLQSTLGDVSWMIQNGIDPNLEAGVTASVSASVPAMAGASSSVAPDSVAPVAQAGEGGVTFAPTANTTNPDEVIQELWGKFEQWLRETGQM